MEANLLRIDWMVGIGRMGSKGGSNLGINITDKCNRAEVEWF